MNIFVTDANPVIAAGNLDDKRLVKMILETAQLLSTVFHNKGVDEPVFNPLNDILRATGQGGLYRPTHKNHPCTIWAGETLGNFHWLVSHGLAMNTEYKRRFKTDDHKSSAVISRCFDNTYRLNLDNREVTPFANCTPFKDQEVVSAYRRYMTEVKWVEGTKWTDTNPPDWYFPQF